MKNNTERQASSADACWAAKEIQLGDVAHKISNGSNIYIGSAASTAEATLKQLVQSSSSLQDIQILQMVPGGNLPHLKENPDQFRTRTFFSFSKTPFHMPNNNNNNNGNNDDDEASSNDNKLNNNNNNNNESLADYTPMSVSAVPRLLREKQLQVDVAIIKVTEPHKGFCSLGCGVEFTRDFIRHANIVIAEVTRHMPWTEGPSKISVKSIDWWLRVDDKPLLTTEELWPEYEKNRSLNVYSQAVRGGIGQNISRYIPDGATLKFGVNPVPFIDFSFLRERKHLGIHTDVLSEDLYELQRDGIIDNSQKTIDQGRTVTALAHGSQELYEYLDRNPAIEFHPTSYINDPQVIAKIDNFVAILGALKIDLTGQVATESIAHKFYGGIWADTDAVTGARLSKGGKSIVALPSKSLHGRSNVLFALPRGTGVSITRSDIQYVVTEYGSACLYGKSIRERCLALVAIAHPDFRAELLAQAKENHYISHNQPGLSFQSRYPQQFECLHTTKSGRSVFCRPIKAVDEDQLRSFFHKLSNHSVYLRYFRVLKSMPQRILQKTTDLDYSRDMAIVILYPPDAAQQELIGIGQWVADKDGVPEIAFQVRDDWQGEGLGTFLFQTLLAMCEAFGITQLKADVLGDNIGMRRVFEKSSVPRTSHVDFGVISYRFHLSKQNNQSS